jgi:hypothetical protein
MEGRIDMTGKPGRIHKQIPYDLKEKRILEIDRGRNISLFIQNSLWKNLWTSRQTDYRMNQSCLLKSFLLRPRIRENLGKRRTAFVTIN